MIGCVLLEAIEPASLDTLTTIARGCSPRVRRVGERAVAIDLDGLSRVWGTPADIARDLTRQLASAALTSRVAVATTLTSAWLLAHARSGTTVAVEDREAIGSLPLGWLAALGELDPALVTNGASGPARRVRRPSSRNFRAAPSPDGLAPSRAEAIVVSDRSLADLLAVLARWGLRTMRDLATLPRSDVQARLGPLGACLHQAASGEDLVRFVPADDPVRFVDRMPLEWPIDTLEPLAFVLAGQCDRLSAALERADRGAVAIHTRLTLVTRDVHERVLRLSDPIREPRVLRTLVLLDLEAHPPSAGIDVVEIEVAVSPGRIIQGSLLARTVPAAEDLATLLARLSALVGESRVGAPADVDTFDARAVGMRPFAPAPVVPDAIHPVRPVSPVLRRFRQPVVVRVVVDHGRPARVVPTARDLPGGRILTSAGPWRTSGWWWSPDHRVWDRDEWDVELATSGVVYRLARSRASGEWEIEGIFD